MIFQTWFSPHRQKKKGQRRAQKHAQSLSHSVRNLWIISHILPYGPACVKQKIAFGVKALKDEATIILKEAAVTVETKADTEENTEY